MDFSAEINHSMQIVDINLAPITLAISILDDSTPLPIKDELRYCREINRIHGLWTDYLWHHRQQGEGQ